MMKMKSKMMNKIMMEMKARVVVGRREEKRPLLHSYDPASIYATTGRGIAIEYFSSARIRNEMKR